jgi:hypothetical protein
MAFAMAHEFMPNQWSEEPIFVLYYECQRIHSNVTSMLKSWILQLLSYMLPDDARLAAATKLQQLQEGAWGDSLSAISRCDAESLEDIFFTIVSRLQGQLHIALDHIEELNNAAKLGKSNKNSVRQQITSLLLTCVQHHENTYIAISDSADVKRPPSSECPEVSISQLRWNTEWKGQSITFTINV